jgi:hypothetical protein
MDEGLLDRKIKMSSNPLFVCLYQRVCLYVYVRTRAITTEIRRELRQKMMSHQFESESAELKEQLKWS